MKIFLDIVKSCWYCCNGVICRWLAQNTRLCHAGGILRHSSLSIGSGPWEARSRHVRTSNDESVPYFIDFRDFFSCFPENNFIWTKWYTIEIKDKVG